MQPVLGGSRNWTLSFFCTCWEKSKVACTRAKRHRWLPGLFLAQLSGVLCFFKPELPTFSCCWSSWAPLPGLSPHACGHGWPATVQDSSAEQARRGLQQPLPGHVGHTESGQPRRAWASARQRACATLSSTHSSTNKYYRPLPGSKANCTFLFLAAPGTKPKPTKWDLFLSAWSFTVT